MGQLASIVYNIGTVGDCFSPECKRCIHLMFLWWILSDEWSFVMYAAEFELFFSSVITQERYEDLFTEVMLALYIMMGFATYGPETVPYILSRYDLGLSRLGIRFLRAGRDLGNDMLYSLPELINFLRQTPYSLIINMAELIQGIMALLRQTPAWLSSFIDSPIEYSKFIIIYAINFTYVFFMELRKELSGDMRSGFANTPLLIPVGPSPAKPNVPLHPSQRRTGSESYVQNVSRSEQVPLHVRFWQRISAWFYPKTDYQEHQKELIRRKIIQRTRDQSRTCNVHDHEADHSIIRTISIDQFEGVQHCGNGNVSTMPKESVASDEGVISDRTSSWKKRGQRRRK